MEEGNCRIRKKTQSRVTESKHFSPSPIYSLLPLFNIHTFCNGKLLCAMQSATIMNDNVHTGDPNKCESVDLVFFSFFIYITIYLPWFFLDLQCLVCTFVQPHSVFELLMLIKTWIRCMHLHNCSRSEKVYEKESP